MAASLARDRRGDHPLRVKPRGREGATVTRGDLSRDRKEANVPAKADVDEATKDTLAGLSRGDQSVLGEMVDLRTAAQQRSGLDARTFSLVKIAALIAVDAPPASYMWQVANALDSGATPRDLVGVLRAVAPHVGGPRAMAAAPELMIALGLDLPNGA
jgi:4-carboxymuconolactone decarboxylase